MSHLITIQSYRAGIGKSTLATNIATALALEGRHVALIDFSFHSPTLHHIFQVNTNNPESTLASYINHSEQGLTHLCQQVTQTLRLAADIPGELYLVPNTAAPETASQKGAWLDNLPDTIADLIETFDLDFIIFDNHAGIDPIHMIQLAMSHTLITVLHPGQQDYQGTGVLLEVAQELEIPAQIVIANEVPTSYNLQAIAHQLTQTYACHDAFAIPYNGKLMALSHTGIFTLRYNGHNLTDRYKQIADTLWVD